MKIDVLSASTVKITLEKSDMESFAISYEALSRRTPETRRLLTRVLRRAREQDKRAAELDAERLFVEAFPKSDGGCMLYVSSIDADGDICVPERKQAGLLLEVAGVSELLAACAALYGVGITGAVYEKGGRYRIYSRDCGKRERMLASEFGEVMEASAYNAAVTREHFALIDEGGVECIGITFERLRDG